MQTLCYSCGETPAAVFRPDVALCKPCHRSELRRDIDEHATGNEPYCATCSTVLRRGRCVECATRTMREFVASARSVA